MDARPLSPNVDVVQDAGGVRYILRTAGFNNSNALLGFAFILRTPLVAAGVAAWFLWLHAGQVPSVLTALAGIYVAQMIYVARLPWILFRQHLWQQVIARFGHGEIELDRDRLYSGNRAGIFRSSERRTIADFRRVIVYVYDDPSWSSMGAETTACGIPGIADEPAQSSGVPPPLSADGEAPNVIPRAMSAESRQAERAVLAIEISAKTPWLLVDGFSRSEILTLAEDLHRRLAPAIARHGLQGPLPPVDSVETTAEALYPPLPPDFYRRKKPKWLAIHLAGAAGLAALTKIALQTGAWQISSTKFAILVGWLSEFLIVTCLFYLARPSKSESTAV